MLAQAPVAAAVADPLLVDEHMYMELDGNDPRAYVIHADELEDGAPFGDFGAVLRDEDLRDVDQRGDDLGPDEAGIPDQIGGECFRFMVLLS